MTGWYPCVKDALLERGWAHNPDRESHFFDLKWTLNSHDLAATEVESWQLTNHFKKTRGLVTKVGLSESLQSLVWFARSTADFIFPRCYDLSNVVSAKSYVDDHRALEARRLLQALVKCHRRDPSTKVNPELVRAAFNA